MKSKFIILGAIVACSAWLGVSFGAKEKSVDWGKPEWNGGYIQIPATETNLTLQIGMRDDGVVVWRKVKRSPTK